jgi:TolA-binding protein
MNKEKFTESEDRIEQLANKVRNRWRYKLEQLAGKIHKANEKMASLRKESEKLEKQRAKMVHKVRCACEHKHLFRWDEGTSSYCIDCATLLKGSEYQKEFQRAEIIGLEEFHRREIELSSKFGNIKVGQSNVD